MAPRQHSNLAPTCNLQSAQQLQDGTTEGGTRDASVEHLQPLCSIISPHFPFSRSIQTWLRELMVAASCCRDTRRSEPTAWVGVIPTTKRPALAAAVGGSEGAQLPISLCKENSPTGQTLDSVQLTTHIGTRRQ